MSDDWRLQIDFREAGPASALRDHLDSRELEHDLSTAFHDRVIVSHEGSTVFLYAGDREQAEKALELIQSFAAQEGEQVDIDFSRWHPLALEWRPADQPLPETAEAEAAEHRARVADERGEVEEQGYPEYEVRVSLPSWKEAEDFAERLRAEGLPTVHRWRHLLIGANDEDQAEALAERIRGEAPSDSKVAVEGDLRDVIHSMPPQPFAFLGGLGG